MGLRVRLRPARGVVLGDIRTVSLGDGTVLSQPRRIRGTVRVRLTMVNAYVMQVTLRVIRPVDVSLA